MNAEKRAAFALRLVSFGIKDTEDICNWIADPEAQSLVRSMCRAKPFSRRFTGAQRAVLVLSELLNKGDEP